MGGCGREVKSPVKKFISKKEDMRHMSGGLFVIVAANQRQAGDSMKNVYNKLH